MAMNNPPHPGGIVKRQCLEPLGLSVTRAAQGLGVTRQALSELINERTAVSVEMAIRLSKAFGSTPETWLGMQMSYDLWKIQERSKKISVERSELINERTAVSVEMAIRLSKAFGSTPETWLGMQMSYDLWKIQERSKKISVERFAAA